MAEDEARTTSVSRDIAASPAVAWALISDVTRMPEWSPENTSCAWVKGASGPAVGARFKGSNETRGHSWDTLCTITECEPGAIFAFESTGAGMKVARWEYLFEPTESGCQATETWVDQRGWFMNLLSKRVSGVTDRQTHNNGTMTETLDHLAAAAEAGRSAPSSPADG